MILRFLTLATFVITAFLACEIGQATEPTESIVDFQRHILPILSEHCTQCHGVDSESRQGGLRLDESKYAIAGGDSGQPAITPGKPESSLMLSRIASNNADELMPPSHINKPLSQTEIGLLRRWIEQGARYESHWAFTPPKKKTPPGNEKNPIDAFVHEGLTQIGVQPAPPASSNILARRIYLDAIGIPPSPQELQAFFNSSIQENVDRLLETDRYGEKWARHWLDVARYSDTNGYEKDMRRDQWAWRDWVIAAINRDMPYDQFIIEQIAGDLLPNASQDNIVATGFLRNSMLNEEGAIVPEQFRMVEMFDRIDCIGKATLGLTTQCAQCHSHKFDPISQDDYYGMFAFINNCYEAQSAVYTPEQLELVRSIQTNIAELENKIRQENPNWQSELNAWTKSLEQGQPNWQVISFDDMNSVSGLNHPATQPDGAILMTGHSSSEVYMIGSPDLQGVTGIRLEVLNHGDLPLRGPGRNANGMWQLHSIDLFIKKPDANDWEKLMIAKVTADYSSPETKDAEGKNFYGPVAFIHDGKAETFWTSDRGIGRRNQASVAVLAFEEPLAAPAGTRFKIAMHMGDNIGCCRFSACTSPQPTAPSCDQAVILALQVPEAERSEKDLKVLFTGWRKSKPEYQVINKQIDAQWDRMPQPYTTVMHLVEREPRLARPTRMLDRGEWDRPKQAVGPHVPAALHPLRDLEVPPRLAFAKWLVDARSPLAARVQVNRIWQSIFGEGLVETSEDFGTRTPIPDQVDLLDYLAVDFMEHGWSQKYLVKLILTSKTYQQSSANRPELAERDPKNKRLGRGPRFRAEAESVRDIALSVSGLLHHKLGGPGIIPPVPQNVLNYNYVVPTFWTPATGPERYRRALYVFRKRSMPDPVMSSFDSPNGDFACARRVRSNTPLAALAGLNETIFVEAAQALALRILREAGTDEEARIRHAYLLCVSREPKVAETLALRELLQQQRTRIAEGWLNPREIATGDAAKLPELPAGATPQDAAAWTIASRVLLNLDETISKN